MLGSNPPAIFQTADEGQNLGNFNFVVALFFDIH
jgi:hypothetical protein